MTFACRAGGREMLSEISVALSVSPSTFASKNCQCSGGNTSNLKNEISHSVIITLKKVMSLGQYDMFKIIDLLLSISRPRE